MSDHKLFRDEALEFHGQHRGPGDVLRAGAAWIDRLYWLLLALVPVAAVLAWLIEVDGRRLVDLLVGT